MSDQEYVAEYGYDCALESAIQEDERDLVDRFFAKFDRKMREIMKNDTNPYQKSGKTRQATVS
jgi:hypothetical protein